MAQYPAASFYLEVAMSKDEQTPAERLRKWLDGERGVYDMDRDIRHVLDENERLEEELALLKKDYLHQGMELGKANIALSPNQPPGDCATRNFNWSEFVCPCGCGALNRDQAFVDGLQQLRDILGTPISITETGGGTRCKRYNEKCGGAPDSEHRRIAADIVAKDVSPSRVADVAETIPIFASGGIGRYSWGTHLDPRRGKARWNG